MMPRKTIRNTKTKSVSALKSEYQKLQKQFEIEALKKNIEEVKRAKFGMTSFINIGDQIKVPLKKEGIQKWNRKEIWVRAYRDYNQNQLARPIINLSAGALFKNDPDFQGDEKLVKFARKVVDDSEIDWFDYGVDFFIFGGTFLRIFESGEDFIIRSVFPPHVDIITEKGDAQTPVNYILNRGTEDESDTDPKDMFYIKTNAIPNQIYGESELSPLFYWFDVLDNLYEKVWVRGAQYFGAPVVVIEGIPASQQTAVQNEIQSTGWRTGKLLLLPGSVEKERPTAKVLNFGEGFDVKELVDRVFRYIVIASGIPQHLLMESDASRGVAMFSTPTFEYKIMTAQRKWSRGLKRLFVEIMRRKGLVDEETPLSEINFKIGWLPVFNRDEKEFIQSVSDLVVNGILSKKSAREKLNLDNSEEEEQIKKQKTEDEADAQRLAKTMGANPQGQVLNPSKNPPQKP